MDELDLDTFNTFMKDFSRIAGDSRMSDGLSNLMMIQKGASSNSLVAAKLDDDEVYSTRSSNLGVIRKMKVELTDADEHAFEPLLKGLRTTTLNVRLRSAFSDIIDPLVSELYIQQLDQMKNDNENHRIDVVYYRSIISSLENLGKETRTSFLESTLLGYRRFIRNPVWTSLDFTLKALQTVVLRPLMGILTGFGKKSDTDRIVDAIERQTEFMRTGKIERPGMFSRLFNQGVLGIVTGSFKDAFSQLLQLGRPATRSPDDIAQKQRQEMLFHDSQSIQLLSLIMSGEDVANKQRQEMIHQNDLRNIQIVKLLDLQRAQIVVQNGIMRRQIEMMTHPTISGHGAVDQYKEHLSEQASILKRQFDLQSHSAVIWNKTSELQSKIIPSAMEYYENVASKQLEEQKNIRDELDEHNDREKRRSFFGILRTLVPGIIGVVGGGVLGAMVWDNLPSPIQNIGETIGSAIVTGFSSLASNLASQVTSRMDLTDWAKVIGGVLMFTPLGMKVRAIGILIASIATLLGADAEHGGAIGIAGGTQGIRDSASRAVGSGQAALSDPNNPITQRQRRLAQEQLESSRAQISDLQRRLDEPGIPQHVATRLAVRLLRQQELEMRALEQLESIQERTSVQSRSTGSNFLHDFIARHEGLVTEAEPDVAGVWTIGFGTTRIDGRAVRPGDTITEERARQLMEADVAGRRQAIQNLVSIPLEPHQLDALTSLSYNIGMSAFAGSTLLEKLNSGDITGAGAEISRWNQSTINGVTQPVSGLTNRREEERQLFMGNMEIPVENTSPTVNQSAIDAANASATRQPAPLSSGSTSEGLLANISNLLSELIDVTRESGSRTPDDFGTSFSSFGRGL